MLRDKLRGFCIPYFAAFTYINVVQMYLVTENIHKNARKLYGMIQDCTWSNIWNILEQFHWLKLPLFPDVC